jgi:1,4-alpha-glucan branching enzyme
MFIESPPIGALSQYSAKRNLHRANFFCVAPQAKQVSLIGDFNEWDPKATPMARQPDGRWLASLELSHGYHQYLFLVDSERVLDPGASGKARNERNEPVSLRAIS